MKCNVFSTQCFCSAHAQMTLLESNIAKTLHFISLVVDARFAHPMNTENYLNFFNQLMIQSINRVFLGWLTHRQTQSKNHAANNGKTTVTPLRLSRLKCSLKNLKEDGHGLFGDQPSCEMH